MKARSLSLARVGVYLFLIGFTFFALFPVVWTLSTSLKPELQATAYPPELIPRQITLDSYIHVVRKTEVLNYIWNTFAVSGGALALVLASSALAGYAFSRFRFPGRRVIMLGLLICVMVSGATKLIPLYLMLLQVGLLNSHLGLILVYSAELIPISVWLIKAYVDTLPEDLDEAALIDGAGRLRVFSAIILPLSLPAIIAVGLQAFIRSAQEFIYASTFISEPSLKTAPVGLYVFFTEVGVQWTYLAAASILIVTPVILVFLALQRWFMSGMTAGAIK